MGKLLDDLKAYLETSTPGQKYTDWKAMQQFENVGPDAKEFVEKQLESNQIKQTRGPVIFDYIQREGSDDMEIIVPDYKEIVFENGRYILRDKKPQYPKTYDECCQHLGCDDKLNVGELIPFQQLVNARNAYWKIAGEEMGLDKPWEPDWTNTNSNKYCIYYVGNEIKKQPMVEVHHLLAFPTTEIRDTFFENFKELIEQCKYFL